MTDIHNRYPGAQPFPDNDFSRRTFFGRAQASLALADQILANRLVVVYAKSGLGKTSLLNAGVAPRLREAGSLPLFVRVNDVKLGPLASVLDGIRAEAERQKVEYVHGESGSLWTFFKSVEFWRGDLLLAPVLILDQFEELFTLQPEEARDTFLTELGYLIRGVPPPSIAQADPAASTIAPSVRVVLSLREDFLGLLEEAADRIPQIMDHRFRLTPLNYETAAEAITGPAAIHDPDLATKPFRLDPSLITTILDHLTKSTTAGRSAGSRSIEPFHLQLVCQRIEKGVAAKQRATSDEIVFTFADFGGENALEQTLVNFYADAIQCVPDRRLRPVARRLCEQFLISPEGRRLSLEQRELQRQLGLPSATLSQLVESRLLRTDRRSDSTYYELSHDALVEPVLASRRMQALVMGWVAVIGGSIISIAMGLMILICSAVAIFGTKNDTSTYIGFTFIVALAAMIGSFTVRWARSGIRMRKRYRRRAPGEGIEELPTHRPLWDRFLGWTLVGVGSTLLILWILIGLFATVILGSLGYAHGQLPHWLAWASNADLSDAWQSIHDRPWIEIPWMVFSWLTVVLFGGTLLRQGGRRLWSRWSRPKTLPGSWVLPFLKVLFGIVAFLFALKGAFILRHCLFTPHEALPNWYPKDVLDLCRQLEEKGWKGMDWDLAVFLIAAGWLSIAFLRRGVQYLRSRWLYSFLKN